MNLQSRKLCIIYSYIITLNENTRRITIRTCIITTCFVSTFFVMWIYWYMMLSANINFFIIYNTNSLPCMSLRKLQQYKFSTIHWMFFNINLLKNIIHTKNILNYIISNLLELSATKETYCVFMSKYILFVL